VNSNSNTNTPSAILGFSAKPCQTAQQMKLFIIHMKF
jgi:hypothetical protein